MIPPDLKKRVAVLEAQHGPTGPDQIVSMMTDEEIITKTREILTARGYPDAGTMPKKELLALARQEWKKEERS
jgi:hypothetical protein